MNSIATNWRTTFLALFLFSGLIFFANQSFAQAGRVNQYTTTKFTETYTSIGGSSLGWADDATFSTILPFAFNFDNTARTASSTMYLNTNGWVSWNSNYTWQYVNMVGNSTFPNSIVWASEDMEVIGGVYASVTGSSPNRVFRIEMTSVRGYGGTGTYSNVMVRLYETTNVIEILYSNPGAQLHYSGNSMGVGLNGGTSPSFASLSYQSDIYLPNTHVRFTPPRIFDQRAAVSPESINFGNISAGNSSPNYAVTVRNLGVNDNLIINSAIISGTSDFTVVSSPASNVVAPGATATYQLRFSPQAAGARTAVFSVNTNGLDSGNQQVNLTGFGLAPAVEFGPETALFRKTRTRLGETITQTLTVKSTGQGPLNITGMTLTGEYAGMYSVTRKLGGPLLPGMTDTLFVTFAASEEGLRTANLTITTDALQNPNKTISLHGLGILPRLLITPTVVHFDSVGMGDTAWRTVRLENTGSDTLAVRLDYVTFADRDFAYFGLEGADSLIAPESFRDVQIRFTPTTQGSRQARLRFTTNIPMTFESERRDTSVFILDIYGTAVPYGLISVSGPTKLDSVIIGREICRTVTISNNGQIPLTITSATIAGPEAADFTINGLTLPATIAANGSIDVQVCGTPSARGLRMAVVDVTSTSSEKMTVTQLPLAVYGLEVCAQPSTMMAFENEIVLVGTSSTAQILINNCGDVPTVYTAVVDGTGYTLTSASTSGMIAPGDNATFEVSFNPATMSALPGTLTVTGQDVTTIVVTLAGTGGNVMITAANTRAPETAVGATSAQFTVTVTNTGNMELTPGEPTISNTEFAYVAGSGPATIAAGASGTYSFTFTPQASGNRSATVTFPGAAPALAAGANSFILNGSTPTGAVRPVASNGYELMQNYPNPFNPSTVITFTMAEAGMAKIVVSDVTGNVVTTVAEQFFGAGENTVTFDASSIASGTYFYELIANGTRLQRSMLLNK